MTAGNALLPMAFPEGSPDASGLRRGTRDRRRRLRNDLESVVQRINQTVDPGRCSPVQPSDDGLTPVPYTGSDAERPDRRRRAQQDCLQRRHRSQHRRRPLALRRHRINEAGRATRHRHPSGSARLLQRTLRRLQPHEIRRHHRHGLARTDFPIYPLFLAALTHLFQSRCLYRDYAPRSSATRTSGLQPLWDSGTDWKFCPTFTGDSK